MRINKKTPTGNLLLLVFIAVLLIFIGGRWGGYLRLALGGLTAPLYNWTAGWRSEGQSATTLKAENEKLQKQLQSLVVDYARLHDLERENQELEQLLNYTRTNPADYVVADIIANTVEPESNVLILNRGERDGLQVGMPVVYGDGILVGKISRTDTATSEMILLDNSNFSTTAIIANGSSTPGIVSGHQNLGIAMRLIPQDEAITVGDVVLTSGREQYIPQGLLIGTVNSIQADDNDFFQSATIVSPVKSAQLFSVLVLRQINE